ncbi:MAG: metallophosphoesterase, partial [Clostridia bacterium]|nr:metallophosphoesterase [Clostridia bacterium]
DGLNNLLVSDGFNVLMFHRANLLDVFKNTDFDLILSGHMHGGQFRIPGIGGVVSPKTNFMQKGRIFFPKYFGGEYSLDDTKMIVSRGIGNPTILPRVFNRPEICSITLKCDN